MFEWTNDKLPDCFNVIINLWTGSTAHVVMSNIGVNVILKGKNSFLRVTYKWNESSYGGGGQTLSIHQNYRQGCKLMELLCSPQKISGNNLWLAWGKSKLSPPSAFLCLARYVMSIHKSILWNVITMIAACFISRWNPLRSQRICRLCQNTSSKVPTDSLTVVPTTRIKTRMFGGLSPAKD